MLLFAGSLLASPLLAQEAKSTANTLLSAFKARAELAAGMADNQTAADKALDTLRAMANPSGLPVDGDADFAFAAIDIGHRLIGMHKPVAAEALFQAAEVSLNAVIDRTPDSSARDKVQYLEARAHIRAEFLGRLAEGRGDLDAALKLLPGNQRLRQIRRQLPADPATTLQNHQELSAKG